MKIREVMSRNVVSCAESDPSSRAAQLMWEHDCGFVPVLRDGVLQGVVTDRDLCMGAYTKGLPLSSIRVGDVMAKNVRSCGPGAQADEICSAMARDRIRRMPVVEDGRLVGIVSLNDLAIVAGSQGAPSSAEIGETLAAICTHRHEWLASAEAE